MIQYARICMMQICSNKHQKSAFFALQKIVANKVLDLRKEVLALKCTYFFEKVVFREIFKLW